MWAIAIAAGGLRCEPPPPRDPVKCQLLADKYIDNHRRGVPLPRNGLIVGALVPLTRLRNTALGWTGEQGELVIADYADAEESYNCEELGGADSPEDDVDGDSLEVILANQLLGMQW